MRLKEIAAAALLLAIIYAAVWFFVTQAEIDKEFSECMRKSDWAPTDHCASLKDRL